LTCLTSALAGTLSEPPLPHFMQLTSGLPGLSHKPYGIRKFHSGVILHTLSHSWQGIWSHSDIEEFHTEYHLLAKGCGMLMDYYPCLCSSHGRIQSD